MKPLVHVLCLILGLALTRAESEPLILLNLDGHDGHERHVHGHEGHPHGHVPDRCQGLEMDAVTVNEDGVPLFFKGEYVFKGFDGPAEPINQTFPGLTHVDVAFHVQHEENPLAHDRLVFFVDDKVFSYFQHKLEDGYPKLVKEDFPGIPDHPDAAVECPKADCEEDSVLFFDGKKIYKFTVKTKDVQEKEFENAPNCTSAFRYMEHYYGFHGTMFSRFHPKTDFVFENPKDARGYFMRCSHFGNHSDHVERERCSRVHLDAITGDGDENLYAFRGRYLLSKSRNETLNAHLIEEEFKELHSDVDAVFFYNGHLHMMKDDLIHVYKVGSPHVHLDGYPKPIREEFGFDGPVDAAFICDDDVAHIVKGPNMISVNMSMTPHTSIIEHPLFRFPKVDAILCHLRKVKAIVGNYFYVFQSPMDFVAGKSNPVPHKVSVELFGCDH